MATVQIVPFRCLTPAWGISLFGKSIRRKARWRRGIDSRFQWSNRTALSDSELPSLLKCQGRGFLAFPLNPLRSRICFSIFQGSMQGRKPTGTLEFDGNRPFSFRGREYCLLKFNGLQLFNSFFFSRFPQIAFPQAFYPPKPLHPLIAQPNPMHKGYRESELKWCRYRAGGVCAICAPRGPG